MICKGCGKEIENPDDHLAIIEIVEAKPIWRYMFHDWFCVAKYIIKNRMIEVTPVE
jgi:hypothetical protein